MVVLGTADLEPALGASVQAVCDGGVGGAAGHAHGVGQHATVGVVGVASHQVPTAIALAGVELGHPGVVHVDGETVSSATGLGAVAAARHVTVSSLGGRGRCGVGAPALAAVLGACVLVA